jgi:hypothetical protein
MGQQSFNVHRPTVVGCCEPGVPPIAEERGGSLLIASFPVQNISIQEQCQKQNKNFLAIFFFSRGARVTRRAF